MFGHQIHRHCQFTSLILLLAIFLAACASQTSQVESTPTISSEVTTDLPPMDTPAPTLTDEPYREPTATPTAEPIATPEPTSMPEWNFEENGPLPSVTSRNGEMTLNADGSVVLTFVVGEKNSPVYGQEFSHTIPTLSGEVIDISGAPAGTLSLVVEPLEDREPMIGSNYTPAVKMVNASGEVMAFYDYTSGVWKNTYENLYTGLGQQELAEWMPQELGLLDIYVNNQDASNGEFTHIALSGRPIRVFDEHVLYNDKWSKTITWLEAEYNNSGNTLLIAVFDSDDSKMTGMLRVTANDQIDFSRTPHVLDGNFAVPLEKQRVLDLVQASPRIVLNTVIYDPNLLREFNLREWDWRKRDTYPGEKVAHNFWRSALQVDADNHALQLAMIEDWLNDTEAVVDNSRWGYIALGVLVDDSE